ncbi:hypothetical protein BT96DRAFT_1004446 [Gymnopus androsaceus JB14]|uniref:Uncharacterized protein n=1 Tax=Gymnopus androsaceus JB14 TaxID=1447944 RepID=A0A6A4GSF9_9AGAR|nr:hypothetical protein BT96DRAFT_1004446 [Gymnopus androsaceus JB14]
MLFVLVLLYSLVDLQMKSYKGLVGCKYPTHDVFVTSPNMKTLLHLLLGNQQICMRQQLHFGEHDPCLVAQPFNKQTAYLCFIPYPYTSNATNTAPWTVPSESAFEPINGHRLSQNPLGLIPEDSVCALEMHFHNLLTSFSQLPPSERSISSFHSLRMKDYKNRIRFLLNCLRTPMLWDEAIHCLVCAQHCALELEALQTLVTSVGLTWDTQPFVVHALRDVVGTLTEQPAVAQKLYQAGILVWFFCKLCHLNDLLLVGCWSTETNPIPICTLPPQYSFDDATPLRLILYSGLLNNLSWYKAMGRYSWSQAFPSLVWGPDPAVAGVSFNHTESSALARQIAPAPLSSMVSSSSLPSSLLLPSMSSVN